MQLDSQRLFFEEKMNSYEEKSNLELSQANEKLKECMNDNIVLKENLSQINKEKTNLEKKHSVVRLYGA